MAASCVEPGDLVGFSALACRDRWLALQRLREAAGVECLLLVLGPDANFSRGSEVAFNWLLGGLSGRDLLAAPLDRKYEECVVCLSPSRSTVFCKHASRDEVVARTSMWEGCEVVVPTQDEEADVDVYDSRKVGAFMRMVAACASIGVALAAPAGGGGDLKMEIERWPLVQAYGYDEYGHGFLTLKKSVVNLEPLLQRNAYPRWDLQSIVWAQGQVKKLAGAWQEALLVQDRNSPLAERHAQATVTAPLVDYFEYGRLALTDEDICELRGDAASQGPLNPAPRVLVGPAESSQILQGVAMDDLSSPSSPAPEGALHTVWEAVDPLAGISAARTYALSSTVCTSGPESEQLRTLLRAYTAAADCCRHLLLADTLSSSVASPGKEAELRQAAVGFVRSQFPDVSGDVHVLCDLVDATGMASAQPLQAGCAVLLFLRVAVAGVACPSSGAALGTVAYGDSIFCAVPPSSGMAASSRILTWELPRFAFWIAPNELERSQGIKAGTDSAQGIGVPTVKYVALGHRPGVRVPLEPPKPPPDPLGLGNPIETSIRGALALDIGGAGPGQPLVGLAKGTAWTFDSGRMVLSSLHTGHVLLQVCRNEHGFPAVEAFDGLVWVPVQLLGEGLSCRLAAAVSPFTASQWRNFYVDAAEDAPRLPDVPDVEWVSGAGGHGPATVTDLDPERAFVSTVALSATLGGQPLCATCGAAAKDAEALRGDLPRRRCIWVAGLPGCGALDVAAPLARALGALLVDLGAVADLGAGPATAEQLAGALAAAAAAALQASPEGAQPVVVCDVHCSPCEVITDLAASRPFADSFYISHVVAVLEPSFAYPWGSARHPLALSLAHRSWVTLVVVQDTGVVEAGVSVRERNALRDQLLLQLRACRGSGHVLLKPTTNALLDCLAQEQLPSAAQLALAMPRLSGAAPAAGFAGLGASCGMLGQLRRVFVPVEAPLDVAALRVCCAACLRAAAQAVRPRAGEAVAPSDAAWRGLFCVEARVVGAVAEELWSREPEDLWNACSSGSGLTVHQLVLSSQGEVRAPQHWAHPHDRTTGVTWWWHVPSADPSLDLPSLAVAALARCHLQLPAPQPLWSLADIPAEELARLEAEVQGAALPDGYFSTSTGYVDVDGNRRKDHPELDGRVQALLQRHNAAVEARNAMLLRLAALPMFGGGMGGRL